MPHKILYTIVALIICVLIYLKIRNKKNTLGYIIITALIATIICNFFIPSNISIFDTLNKTEATISNTENLIPNIELSTKKLELFISDEDILTAITSPDDVEINWYSSNEEIVLVDSDGHIKAVNEGSAEITATVIYGESNDTATCNITVKSPSINLDTTCMLDIGENVILSALTSPESSITWTSSDSDIATVNDMGEVAGINEGTATITATITYNDEEYSADCVITVKALADEVDDILNNESKSNEEGNLEGIESTEMSLGDVPWLKEDNINKNILATTMRGEAWDNCIGLGSSNINADSNAAIIAACDQKYSRFTAEIAPQEGFDESESVTLYIYGGCDDEQTFVEKYTIDFMTETFSVDLDISGAKELYIIKSGNYNQGRIAGQFINGYTGMGVLIYNATLYKE